MNTKVIVGIVAAVLITLLIVWAVDVDVDGELEIPKISADMNYEEGSLPEVDVDVTGDFEMPTINPDIDATGGKMPDVDVNTVDVEVGTEPMEVEVPTGVEVQTETETIEVPTINVDKPEENTVAEEDDL